MSFGVSTCVISCLLLTPLAVGSLQAGRQSMEKSAPEIRARIEASPILPFNGVPFPSSFIEVRGLLAGLNITVGHDLRY